MSFIQKLFGAKPKPDLPFQVGDKVRDLWGQVLVVTEIKPGAENGLGVVRTRNAAGKESSTALITHNLTLVDKSTPLSSDFSIKRVRPDELNAGAYLRPNMIVMHGICQTNSGGYDCEPYRIFEPAISDLMLGTELLRVLKEAATTPIPADLKAEMKKLQEVCKVSSLSKLCENAVHCSVRQKPDEISFLPTRREGKAFHHLPDLTIKISAASTPEEAGKALRNCFQICT